MGLGAMPVELVPNRTGWLLAGNRLAAAVMPQPERRPHAEIRRNRVNPIPREAATAPLVGRLLIVR